MIFVCRPYFQWPCSIHMIFCNCLVNSWRFSIQLWKRACFTFQFNTPSFSFCCITTLARTISIWTKNRHSMRRASQFPWRAHPQELKALPAGPASENSTELLNITPCIPNSQSWWTLGGHKPQSNCIPEVYIG